MEPNWSLLVRTWTPLVFSTAWRILGHRADAEDVTQEVFTQALRLWPGKSVRHWGGWFRKVAVSRSIDRLRQRKPVLPLDGVTEPSHEQPPAARLEQAELADELRQALLQLSEHEACIFCLRYLDELSYDQIAQSLEMETPAVGMALHRARHKLAVHLQALWNEVKT